MERQASRVRSGAMQAYWAKAKQGRHGHSPTAEDKGLDCGYLVNFVEGFSHMALAPGFCARAEMV